MSRLCLIPLILCAPAAAADVPTIDEALQRLYNFDFRHAHEILDKVIAANPQSPLPYGFRAATYWNV